MGALSPGLSAAHPGPSGARLRHVLLVRGQFGLEGNLHLQLGKNKAQARAALGCRGHGAGGPHGFPSPSFLPPPQVPQFSGMKGVFVLSG